MDYKFHSKNGALVKIVVSDIPDELRESVKQCASYAVAQLENGDLLMTTNRADRAKLDTLIERPVGKKSEWNSRRIELLSNAGNNHGNAWTCTWQNVDANSLPPEWEGQLVCYVYE